MPRRSRKNTTVPEENFSKADWNKQSVQALKLTCNRFHLVITGNKETLATRLFDHFHPTPSNNIQITTTATDNTASILSSVMAELNTLKQDIADIRRQNVNSDIVSVAAVNQSPINQSSAAVDSDIPCDDHTESPLDRIETVQQQQPSQLAVHEPGNDLNFILPGANLNQNSYVPPPIKASILQKIQRQEYVDFDELLPTPPHLHTTTQNLFGLDIDSNSSSLLLKKNMPANRIQNFPSWMIAWNLFYQAVLHYTPALHYKMFSHLKIFCNMARKFQFANCYAYDKAQRLQISAQKDIPPQFRTTDWGNINDELFNLYLRDNYLPSCFHCGTYGHYATSCPFKSTHSLTSKNSNFRPLSNNISNSSYPHIANKDSITTDTISNTSYDHSYQQSPPICHRFNRGIQCSKPPCRFSHTCNKCHRAGHPGSRCPNVTSTTFRP